MQDLKSAEWLRFECGFRGVSSEKNSAIRSCKLCNLAHLCTSRRKWIECSAVEIEQSPPYTVGSFRLLCWNPLNVRLDVDVRVAECEQRKRRRLLCNPASQQ